jgi:thiamine-phosphate pyrophosphorylase
MSCRLYLITPPDLGDLTQFAGSLDAALGAGDVACVQLRLKGARDDDVLKAAETLMPIAHAHDAAFLVNDRPDLAKKAGADGAHVGQEDVSCKEARAMLGPDKTVGVTCHNSKHLALLAGEDGADYVAFGAFFPTTTKEAKTRAEPEILSWWRYATTLPCVAIGGVTPENCGPLVTAGTDFLAVSSAVWNDPDGSAAAARKFAEAIAKAPPPE